MPIVSGSPVYGQVLTANSGSWGPEGVTLDYQWNRDGTPVSGAIASTYALSASDIGHTITVTVTGFFAATSINPEPPTPRHRS